MTPATYWSGLGTGMSERVLSKHIRGTATIVYPPDGAHFEIEAPV